MQFEDFGQRLGVIQVGNHGHKNILSCLFVGLFSSVYKGGIESIHMYFMYFPIANYNIGIT